MTSLCVRFFVGIPHGKRLRAEGQLPIRNFARLINISYTINWVGRKLLPVWYDWNEIDSCKLVKYEDLLINPINVCINVADFLSLNLNTEAINNIVMKYDRSNIDKGDLHFNKGKIGRYKTYLSNEQIKKCNKQFGECLSQMGYI